MSGDAISPIHDKLAHRFSAALVGHTSIPDGRHRALMIF
jgi:hypothetical protein